MLFLGESWVVNSLLTLGTILGLFYYYLKSPFDYWKNRRVPYVKPSIFFGNVKDQFLQRKSIFMIVDDIYKGLKNERFGGYFEFRTPVLMIRDPQLVERILIKDFSHFSDRDFGLGVDTNVDPLSGNLFNLKGQLWKNLRNKLTPTFTTGKLRGMMDQMCNCGDELANDIKKQSKANNNALDAKKVGTTFTIDVTASVSFGLQFKPDSPEGIKFREIFDRMFSPSWQRTLRTLMVFYFQGLSRFLRLRRFPKEVNDYLIDLVKTTMEFRKKNNVMRNDFLQLMINLKEQEETGKQMNWKTELSEEDAYLNQMDVTFKEGNQETKIQVVTDECIAAQSFVFLTAGSEAVATSIQYTLFELASNPEIQTKLQHEVDRVMKKYGGKLTYDGLKEMTYLDLITQERFRKYSEVGFLNRVCTTPYVIPGTNIKIEKGTRVVIPSYSIHHDPEYYPDPDKFIPERFEGNNHRTSGTYLTFGDGPRVCIAMRFVILELKMAVARLMSEFTVTLDPRTKVPLEYDPVTFRFLPKGGIWVRFQEREKVA